VSASVLYTDLIYLRTNFYFFTYQAYPFVLLKFRSIKKLKSNGRKHHKMSMKNTRIFSDKQCSSTCFLFKI